MRLVKLITAKDQESLQRAQSLLEAVSEQVEENKLRNDIINVIESIMVYLPMKSHVVKEIARQVKNLSIEEKQLLLRELQPNEYLKQRLQSFSPILYEAINLDLKQAHYSLYRLSNEDYFILSDYTIPIKAGSDFFTAFYLQIEPIELPKLYLSLKYLFGESSRFFDNYKSSFAFPLFTEIVKTDAKYNYLIIINDYKGGIDFSIRRCLEEKIDPIQCFYHDPYEQEFSLEEIRYFISYFCGYLLGIWKIINQGEVMPFYHEISSNNLLYGYCTQEGYFQFEYEEDHQRNEILARLGFEKNL